MQNAELDDAQAGIKIAGRNINNVRYADDTTLMAESEDLKNLLMKVKEESEKVGLKLHSMGIGLQDKDSERNLGISSFGPGWIWPQEAGTPTPVAVLGLASG